MCCITKTWLACSCCLTCLIFKNLRNSFQQFFTLFENQYSSIFINRIRFTFYFIFNSVTHPERGDTGPTEENIRIVWPTFWFCEVYAKINNFIPALLGLIETLSRSKSRSISHFWFGRQKITKIICFIFLFLKIFSGIFAIKVQYVETGFEWDNVTSKSGFK